MKSYSIASELPNIQFEITDINVSKEDYYSGNPYNTTFYVKTVSGDFAGVSLFEGNIKDFIDFVKGINDLYYFKGVRI